MSVKVTDRELFDRCYGSAHTATDLLERLADAPAAVIDAPLQLKQVRNCLREALSAAQELKHRAKENKKTV